MGPRRDGCGPILWAMFARERQTLGGARPFMLYDRTEATAQKENQNKEGKHYRGFQIVVPRGLLDLVFEKRWRWDEILVTLCRALSGQAHRGPLRFPIQPYTYVNVQVRPATHANIDVLDVLQLCMPRA